MTENDTTSITIIRALDAVLTTYGPPDDRFLQALGIPRSLLEDDEARVPWATAIRAWDEAARRSGDPDFGLHFAGRVPRGALSVFEYVLRASDTLEDALHRMLRYQRLVHQGVRLETSRERDGIRITHTVPGRPAGSPRHAVEAAVAGWIVQARGLVSATINPLEVTFRHAAPEDASEHRRLFQATVRFAQPANSMLLRAADLSRKVAAADPALCALLERQAAALMARIPEHASPLERTRQALATELQHGEPTLGRVAKRLGVNARTLQRQLAGAGTGFQPLLDELRCELARRWLAERTMSLAEVSFLLGFSEPSAFHRACRRWFGRTPAQERAALLDPAT